MPLSLYAKCKLGDPRRNKWKRCPRSESSTREMFEIKNEEDMNKTPFWDKKSVCSLVSGGRLEA